MGIFQRIHDAKEGLVSRHQAMKQRQETKADLKQLERERELAAIKAQRIKLERIDRTARALKKEKKRVREIKLAKIKGFMPNFNSPLSSSPFKSGKPFESDSPLTKIK